MNLYTNIITNDILGQRTIWYYNIHNKILLSVGLCVKYIISHYIHFPWNVYVNVGITWY